MIPNNLAEVVDRALTMGAGAIAEIIKQIKDASPDVYKALRREVLLEAWHCILCWGIACLVAGFLTQWLWESYSTYECLKSHRYSSCDCATALCVGVVVSSFGCVIALVGFLSDGTSAIKNLMNIDYWVAVKARGFLK